MTVVLKPMDCEHEEPVFGCRSCIAKARPTAINKAAAEIEPHLAFKALERDAANKRSRRRQHSIKRQNIARDRMDEAMDKAREMRRASCGHVESPVFGCRDCERSLETVRIRVNKPLTALGDDK